MNYNEFITRVDKRLTEMTEKEKTEYIHNLARSIKENDRIGFINSLCNRQTEDTITNKVDEIIEFFKKLRNEEIYFKVSRYEVYGKNYWDNDYKTEYIDNFNIRKQLEIAFNTANILLSQKEYSHALCIYSLMCNSLYPLVSDYECDEEELEIGDLIKENLLHLSIKDISLNLLYTIYNVYEGGERASKLFKYLAGGFGNDIKIEELFMMEYGEPNDISTFLNEWITFLIRAEGDIAGKFLSEACILKGGIDLLCKNAKEYYSRHPVLYKNACEYLLNNKRYDECEEIGEKAVSLISEKLVIRSEIADVAAIAAFELKHMDILKRLYITSFYSNSTIKNFLRLFEFEDYMSITSKAMLYAEMINEKVVQVLDNNTQAKKNAILDEHKKIMHFFNFEFDYAYKECINEKDLLGWNSPIKDLLVPLFILTLNKDKQISKAGAKLVEGIIDKLGFTINDTVCFIKKFLLWKSKVNISESQYQKYINWLRNEINVTSNELVDRKSYNKAAALITAFGEVLESNAQLDARNITITYYKKLHSRKNAFVSEFDSFN